MKIYIFLCIISNILFLFRITFNRPRKRIIYYNIRSESNSLSNWINSRQLIQSFDRPISLNPIREMDEIVEGTRLTRVLSRSPCSTTLPLSSLPAPQDDEKVVKPGFEIAVDQRSRARACISTRLLSRP